MIKNGKRKGFLKIPVALLALVGFLLAWDWAAGMIDKAYLPNPGMVLGAIIYSFQNQDAFLRLYMHEHILASLGRILYGFSVALFIAIPVGLMIGWSVWIEYAATPLIEMIRPIPPISWLGFSIVFFDGIWESSFIVFLGVFFPVLLSTIAGVKSVDPLLVDAARSLGAMRIHVFLKVILPGASTHIMTGIRIGLGIGWMTIVAAEMVGVEGGLGWYVWTMMEISEYDKMFGAMAALSTLGFLMIKGLEYFEQRFARWMGI